MPKTQSVQWNMGPWHFWFSGGLSEKWRRGSTTCFRYLRNVQEQLADGKSLYESRFGTPLAGPLIPRVAEIDFNSNLYERQESSSSIWNKDASRNIHRIRAESWRSLDPRVDHRGLVRHWRQRRFWSRRQKSPNPTMLEPSNCRQHSYFFAQIVPLRQAGHARRQTFRHQRVESFDAGAVPFFDEARSDLLQSSREYFSARRRRSADFSETDRDATEAREDFWSLSGEFMYRHDVVPREQWYMSKESSIPSTTKYIDVVRQAKSNLDKLEESSIDDLWNTDGKELSLKSGTNSRDSDIPNKRPPQDHSWVDGRLTQIQVTSRSVVIQILVCSNKAKQQWDTDNLKFNLHVRR